MYFVAVNYAGENRDSTAFAESCADEDLEPEVLGTDEGVLINEAKRDGLVRVWKEFPYFEQLMNKGWRI